MHCARFGVVGSVHQTLDSCMNQRAGAHGARFNCNKQFAVSQTMVTQRGTCLTQSDDLGVSRGIGVGDIAIPSASDDFALMNDNCADGNFSGFERSLGGAERFFHEEFVRGGRWSFVVGHWSRDNTLSVEL